MSERATSTGRVGLRGVRARVALTVLCVTAVLYSALAVLLFLVVVDNGRGAIERRVDEVLDLMEADLRSGTANVRTDTPDGIVALLYPASGAIPAARDGQLRVVRDIQVRGTAARLVGTASVTSLNDGLRPLHRALWIGVPLASLFTAAIAGLATRRALRPVDEISRLASQVGPDADRRVPVPATGDEIERLASTVNEMLDRIAAGRVAARRFTSDASHELRTPLMALQGELELAERGLGDDESITRMQRQAERLSRLVDDLVLLTTLDEGRPAATAPIDLLELVQQEAEVVAPSTSVTGDPVTVTVDPALMARAVRNLLANARRHAAEHTAATVERDGPSVVLHVDDDGPGVDDEAAAHLFERFVRLDEARSSDQGGAGLGLAIVASVARVHGGTIGVSRSPMGGARFTLRLPDPA